MATLVSEFFGIVGLSPIPPTTMAELIPYMLTVLVGVWLVSAVLRLVGALLHAIMDFRRL